MFTLYMETKTYTKIKNSYCLDSKAFFCLCLCPKEFPTVTLKPLQKPFKTYAKSFAHFGDALNDKHVNEFLGRELASMLAKKRFSMHKENRRIR